MQGRSPPVSHVLTLPPYPTVADDYNTDLSLLQQSFEPPGVTPTCIDLTAEEDALVEDPEMLTVQVQSADEAVVEDVENTVEVTILDISTGEVGMKQSTTVGD